MTATAAALELAERQPTTEEISSNIKQLNLSAVAGKLLEACDIIDGMFDGFNLSDEDMEFVSHSRELAKAVLQ